MPVAFPHFKIRTVTTLDGLWDFAFLGDVDASALNPAALTYTDHIPVPAAFDTLPAYAGKRGIGVYHRTLAIAPGRRARLHFGAVSMACRILVDGQTLKEHRCGYSPFWLDLPASAAAERELIVITDNRYSLDRIPMHEEYFDFYQYGGILRDVTLHELPDTFIQSVAAIKTDFRTGRVDLRITLTGAPNGPLTLTTRIDTLPEQSHTVTATNNEVRLSLQIPSAQPWSPQTPKLYTLRVRLDSPSAPDDFITRIGLRTIETRGKEILLNGQPLRLVGYNRHEAHPQYGPALPYTQLVADLQYLRDLGCNFIRGCHYPQDQRFLDLCDELGFLVWEECLGWQQQERHFTNPRYLADHAAAVEEMITTSLNHPSVILWGFWNEAVTKDAPHARPAFEQVVAQIRKLDPTRLITYASMFPGMNVFDDLVDVISANMYPGWYGCAGNPAPLDSIAPTIRDVLAKVDQLPAGNKPFIIGEIGAEALYGWHDPHNDFFTEEYQAAYLSRAISEYLANPRLSGITLWHFSDARTYGGGYALGRPRAYNNKGTLDEYRRPKQAYYAIRGLLRGPEFASRF